MKTKLYDMNQNDDKMKIEHFKTKLKQLLTEDIELSYYSDRNTVVPQYKVTIIDNYNIRAPYVLLVDLDTRKFRVTPPTGSTGSRLRETPYGILEIFLCKEVEHKHMLKKKTELEIEIISSYRDVLENEEKTSIFKVIPNLTEYVC